MYQHLRIAMEQAQEREKRKQEENNIRRRRRRNTIDTSAPTPISDDLVTTDDIEKKKESNDYTEMIHHLSTDPDESIDIDDFDLASFEENTTESQSGFNSYGEVLIDDQDESFILDDLFPPNDNQNNHNLHLHTTVKTDDFCRQLVKIFRDANISSIHCSRLLKVINSVLPQPNNSPTTLKALYNSMQIEQLFTKRLVCTLCHKDLPYNDKTCSNCNSLDNKSIASIYDVNQSLVFARTLDRILPDIEANRKQINTNYSSSHNNNDIMFNKNYQNLQNIYGSSPFISLLLHLDGIGLTKSSKLTLWLFSCSFIELPVNLRYYRFNMVILSVWIGYREPPIDLWLTECLQQLNYLKKKGIPTRSGINYRVLVYGLTGDCPAIKLATKHVNHQGYWCCWFCYKRGVHVDNKRQYYFENQLVPRLTTEYALYSKKAEKEKKNIFGHLGVSPLAAVLDIPLPRSLVIDYMHVSLLRHTRTVIQYLYQKYLKPQQRNELDELFRYQPFPHFFNRKMRPVKEFSYCKATELRNMLLYGLLPLIRPFLPVQVAAHLSLYVTAMRLLHGARKLGDNTQDVANELMNIYYKDHTLFYTSIQNFVLHLHCHYASQYYQHGSLSNLGTFGQESLLGHFSKNRHGTRNIGQLIINNYNIDFTIYNQVKNNLSSMSMEINGLFDPQNISINNFLRESHNALCSCDNIEQCISIYCRYRTKQMVYHSLIYPRRRSTSSYFVQYSNDHEDNLFGVVELFFTCNNKSYALIHNHSVKHLFTDYFLSSKYHSALVKALDMYFYILHRNSTFCDIVTVDSITNMCIVFTFDDSLVITPLSSSYEHD